MTVIEPPSMMEIVSGILTLAARGEETVSVSRIHSILYDMKPHEPILSGLRFSLTGAVCYSSRIQQAVQSLVDGGSLRLVDRSTVTVDRPRPFRAYLSSRFTASQIQAIHSTSLRYYDRLRRHMTGLERQTSESDKFAKKSAVR